MVYFIQNNEGNIKIGYSKDVKKRMSTLQTSTPHKLILLKEIKGGTCLERDIQNKFNYLRVRGEWFRIDGELLDFINKLPVNSDLNEESPDIGTLPLLDHQMKILGKNIKLARLRRKLSSVFVANKANITRVTLNRIERGNASVSLGLVAKVLFVLNLSQDLEKVAKIDEIG